VRKTPPPANVTKKLRTIGAGLEGVGATLRRVPVPT